MNLDPKVQDAYERIIIAGMKLLYSQQTRSMLESELNRKDPVSDVVAEAVAGVIKIMEDRTQNQLPKAAILPAATYLMLDLMKFMQQSGRADPTDKDVQAASQKLTQVLMAEYKLMDDQIAQHAPGNQAAPGLISQPQGA